MNLINKAYYIHTFIHLKWCIYNCIIQPFFCNHAYCSIQPNAYPGTFVQNTQKVSTVKIKYFFGMMYTYINPLIYNTQKQPSKHKPQPCIQNYLLLPEHNLLRSSDPALLLKEKVTKRI